MTHQEKPMPRNMDNPTFYKAVCAIQSLKDVLARHDFGDTESDSLRFGVVLKLSKESWLIHLDNREDTGVHVHFECTRDRMRDRARDSTKDHAIHLHIETHPYFPGLAGNKEERARRQPEIDLREHLHSVIRPALQSLTVKVVGPNAGHPADDPSANSAGSFPSDLPEDYTVQQYADFLAKVIEAVVPTVDRCIDEVMNA